MSRDDQEPTPPQGETSSNSSRLSNNPTEATKDDETLHQTSVPNVTEIQPAQTQVNPKTGDPETLKPTSPTSPGPKIDSIPSGDAEPGKQDSAAAADRNVQEITPVEKETTANADDTEAPSKNATLGAHPHAPQVTPVEETTSKTSDPPTSKTSGPTNEEKKRPCILKEVIQTVRKLFADKDKSTKYKHMEDLERENHKIKERAASLKKYHGEMEQTYQEAEENFKMLKRKGNEKDLEELNNTMKRMLGIDLDEIDHHKKLQSKATEVPKEEGKPIPLMHDNPVFEKSVEFKDFEARYSELFTELKLCLLCFSVFPNDAIIKKRLMLQWWTCEGFAAKEDAERYFNQLMEKGFIEPVNRNKSPSVGECRMHPFYRSALAILAERARFFNFKSGGEPTEEFTGTFQACLVGDGVISYDYLQVKIDEKGGLEEVEMENVLKESLEKVHLLINIKEHRLEFKPDWFSMMKNVNFIHLGNWRSTDHVEVESTEFLEKVKNMDYLKFLSLQGVANVIKLPESISKFVNLEILNLRACHNLAIIPDNVGRLRSLTHLDMTGCSLDYMPSTLSELKKLKVLKGFVVSKATKKHTCGISDLIKLEELEKLCIYTGLRDFPEEEHVDLGHFKKLQKLTITWTVPGSETRTKSRSQMRKELKSSDNLLLYLPRTLTKLDLKCFPKFITPKWLACENLQNLKKLYIRGGMFSDLGQYQDTDDFNLVWPGKKLAWNVTDLRLKFLSEIELDWTQLKELFPHLTYLEQVDCPKLTFFPCDANGVWKTSEP